MWKWHALKPSHSDCRVVAKFDLHLRRERLFGKNAIQTGRGVLPNASWFLARWDLIPPALIALLQQPPNDEHDDETGQRHQQRADDQK